MSRTWVSALFLALTTCGVDLSPPENARITCGRNSACPSGLRCAENLGYCVNEGTVIPALQVAFTLPRDGDDEVALSLAGVVVLNMDAKVPEDGVITLISEDGVHDVPLVVSVAGAANSLIIEAQTLLFPLTRYVLTVHPGIAPADGLLAVASETTWSATFETAESSDITPPDPVTQLIVEKRSLAQQDYELRWTPSASTDVAGVIAIRHSGSPVTDTPENGRSYAVGQALDASTVVFVGVSNQASDTAPSTEPAYYAVHVFDTALNYSAPVRASEGDFSKLIWCPDHIGRFVIASPDSGTVRLHAASGENNPFGSGTLVPGSDIALDAEGTFEGGAPPFLLGGTVWLRAVINNGDTTFVGPNRAAYLSNAALAVVSEHVELDTPGYFPFSAQQWPGFEAQVDTNPAAGAETWAATAITNNQVVVTIGVTGTYRVRVRPVVPGCPDAPWSVSAPFTAGNSAFVYVQAGATGLGLAPTDPAGTLAAVQSVLDASTAVYVAEGTYDERFDPREGVEYYGGYTSTFSEAARDPLLHPANFTQATNIMYAPTGITPLTVIDGFHFTTTGNGDAIQVYGGSPVLSHNVITTSQATWSTSGIYVASGNPRILHNSITSSITVWLQDGASAVIEDNELLLGSSHQRGAVQCSGATMSLKRNHIIHSGSFADSFGVTLGGQCNADIVGNKIEAAKVVNGAESAGIRIEWGQARIFNNDIYGGYGSQLSTGIRFQTEYQNGTSPSGPVLIANNTIHTGNGGTNVSLGASSIGILMIKNATLDAAWEVRATNNLVFGAGNANFVGFAIDDAFTDLKSIENNLVVSDAAASTTAVFASTFSGGGPTLRTPAELASVYCARGTPVITQGNVITDATLTNLLNDARGADNVLATLVDDDWALATNAPAAAKTGGRTLSGSINCGGTTCGSPANAQCGPVTTDFEGFARSEPYAIGAHEF